MKKWLFPGIFTVILIGLAVFYGYKLQSTNKATNSTNITTPPPPVAVNWQQNGKGGNRIVQIAKGHLPKIMTGVVETDTDCDADAQGISHCKNIIALPNHQKITIIDIHNMNHYPCLNPKDTVTIKPLNNSWAEVS